MVDFAVAIDAKLEAKIRNRNKDFSGFFFIPIRGFLVPLTNKGFTNLNLLGFYKIQNL